MRSNAPELKALSLKQSCFRDSPLEYVPEKKKAPVRGGPDESAGRRGRPRTRLETHHLSGQEPLRDGVLAPGARKTMCLASESNWGDVEVVGGFSVFGLAYI